MKGNQFPNAVKTVLDALEEGSFDTVRPIANVSPKPALP